MPREGDIAFDAQTPHWTAGITTGRAVGHRPGDRPPERLRSCGIAARHGNKGVPEAGPAPLSQLACAGSKQLPRHDAGVSIPRADSSRRINSPRLSKTLMPCWRIGASHSALESSQVSFMKLYTRAQ